MWSNCPNCMVRGAIVHHFRLRSVDEVGGFVLLTLENVTKNFESTDG